MGIVSVNAYAIKAPQPAALQQQGCFVSQGGTNLAPGSTSYLTLASDLTPLLTAAKAVTSISQAGGTATVTTTAAHDFTVGDSLYIAIAGAAPAAYNGTFLGTVTGADTFTYAVPSGTASPATGTITYVPDSANELSQFVTTFFAQGSAIGISVLELGPGNPTDGVTALTAYLDAFPNSAYTALNAGGYFYVYTVPRNWASNSAYQALVANYEAATARTYFATTMTLQNYTAFTAAMKSVLGLIETPATAIYPTNALTALSYASGVVTATTTTAVSTLAAGNWIDIMGCVPADYNGYWPLASIAGTTLTWDVPTALGVESTLGSLAGNYTTSAGVAATEFSIAALVYQILAQNPSSAQQLAPFAFRYLAGVTPWPAAGNATLFATLAAANVNIIGTGAEGGIANSLIQGGTTMDGADFSQWYGVDWVELNLNQQTAAAVIAGSNQQPPLLYNQAGINTLQGVATGVMRSAIGNGMVLGTLIQTQLPAAQFFANLKAGAYNGQCVVNAEPFTAYIAENPNDYGKGVYSGLSVVEVTQRGFVKINYTVDAYFGVS